MKTVGSEGASGEGSLFGSPWGSVPVGAAFVKDAVGLGMHFVHQLPIVDGEPLATVCVHIVHDRFAASRSAGSRTRRRRRNCANSPATWSTTPNSRGTRRNDARITD